MTLQKMSNREKAMEALAESIRLATTDVTEGKYNLQHLRQAADHLIDMRETFINNQGQPDMQGRSFAYREAVREVMTNAGVAPADVSGVLQALRYHMSMRMRERYTPEQLAEWGLLAATPLERQKKERNTRISAQRALVNPSAPVTDADQVIAVLRSINLGLENTDVSNLSASSRKQVNAFLKNIIATAEELLNAPKRR